MRTTIAHAAAAVLLAAPGLGLGLDGREAATEVPASAHGEASRDSRGLEGARLDADQGSAPAADEVLDDDGRGTPYKVDKADNVCGLDEPRALTNPAQVDYAELLQATPEAKRVKRRKIDPDSAEGIRLMTEARTRVLQACESVRADLGYCSVWKKISRRDGDPIDDLTDAVKKEIEGDGDVA